nr:reverse transcriptase domain-containing protein [Tanacetum cinerariifolium]
MDDLVSKFINQFFPPSKTANLRNEITRFQQRALLLDKKNQSSAQATSSTPAPIKAVESNCVTCGGTHSYQNCPATSGNVYQDNINEYVSQAAAANYNQVSSNSSTPAISSVVAELKDMVRALLLDKKNQSSALATSPTPALIKAVESNCVTCGGSGTLPGNTVTNPKEDLKGITTRSGVAYNKPTIPTPSKVVKQGTEATKDQVQTPSSQSTAHVQPPVTQSETPVSEPIAAPVSAPMPNLKPSIPYPSRRDNKGRLILNKLPKKLRDPGKFLIPCEFSGMDECLALADLGASINLMPLSVWKELSLPELTPTCMTLELADRLVSKPICIAKDVKVKVGMFHFPANFVVVDFEPDPRVPLILGSPTPSDDPIVSTTSPTLTPFGDSDFLLFEEANAFLGLEDDPDSPELVPSYYDPEGDI